MKTKLSPVALILLLISIGHAQQKMNYGETPWGPIDYVWSELSPMHCKLLPGPNHRRACPGPPGYQLLYAGPETRPQIIVVTPDRKQHPLDYWDLKDANFTSLEKSATWKLARGRGKPRLLALTLEANAKDDVLDQIAAYTVIAKITPSEVCVVARIKASGNSPAYVASMSTSASSRKCIAIDNTGEKEWHFVIHKLVAKGLFEEAKATAGRIRSPGSRVGAYTNIARAQAAAGDVVAARATLLLGLDLVLSLTDWTQYVDEFGDVAGEVGSRSNGLIAILSTMASVGLDNDARSNLKFVAPSELANALLWIGKAQGNPAMIGGRGDLETAKATFKEAIKLELGRADKNEADSNLWHIVEAQLDMRLLTEAKQTASLITLPSLREVAEQSVKRRMNQPEP